MKKLLLVVVVLSVSGCMRTTSVAEGTYAIQLRFGDVESVATGPAELQSWLLLDKIVVVDKLQQSKLRGFDRPLRFIVTDPVGYYIATGGSLSLDRIFETHLGILEGQGEIPNIENLLKRIDQLELPIVFQNDA